MNLDKQQILDLYNSVGWTVYTKTPDKLFDGLAHSLDIFTKIIDDQLVGLIRTVGDGKTIIYIQDLLIHPNYQRLGIGSELINKVLTKYHDVRQIVLVSNDEEKTNQFYESVGLSKIQSYDGICFVRYL